MNGDLVRIRTFSADIQGRVTLPLSKSISNRLLMLKAYSDDFTCSVPLSDADDTQLLVRMLRIVYTTSGEGEIVIDCDNAGTVLRFLLSFLAQRPGVWILTGSEQMQKRPVGPLVEALHELGANITYLKEPGFPPLKIIGTNLTSGSLSVDSSFSSQYVSSLLMLAMVLPNGLSINLAGEVVSESYITMTIEMMRKSRIDVHYSLDRIVVQKPMGIYPVFIKEYDWSAAAFWFSVAALSQRADIVLNDMGTPESSCQGDAIVASIFSQFGVRTTMEKQNLLLSKRDFNPSLTWIRFNMQSTPDIVLPVVVTIAGLGLGALITGISHLEHKETNRIKALLNELRALNITIEYSNDTLVIHRSQMHVLRPVNTYNDHRMAMAFAPLALVVSNLKIRNPEVISKSYPQFWSNLAQLGFDVKKINEGC